MSRGNRRGISIIFTGLFALASTFLNPEPAQASDTSYYYCRKSEGAQYTDFSLSITGSNVALQPYSSPESPGTRIYHGKVAGTYPSGNVLVDFNTDSQIQFLSPYPDMIFTRDLFVKASSGYIRVYNNGNRANDSIMVCEIKKIFY